MRERVRVRGRRGRRRRGGSWRTVVAVGGVIRRWRFSDHEKSGRLEGLQGRLECAQWHPGDCVDAFGRQGGCCWDGAAARKCRGAFCGRAAGRSVCSWDPYFMESGEDSTAARCGKGTGRKRPAVCTGGHSQRTRRRGRRTQAPDGMGRRRLARRRFRAAPEVAEGPEPDLAGAR